MTVAHTSPAPALEPVTITFRKPIMMGPNEYTRLDISEPTGSDWKEVDGLKGVEGDIVAIARVSGTPVFVVERMGVRDFRKATAALGSFFDDEPDVDAPDPTADVVEENETIMPLRKHIEEDDNLIFELHLREPTAAEWKAWNHLGGTAADIKALATITKYSEATIGKIGIRDIRKAANWIGRFFINAPATGGPS